MEKIEDQTKMESNEASNYIENDKIEENEFVNRSFAPIRIDNSKLERLKNMNFSKKNENKAIEIEFKVNDLYETNEENSNQFFINRKRKNIEASDIEEESNKGKMDFINRNSGN